MSRSELSNLKRAEIRRAGGAAEARRYCARRDGTRCWYCDKLIDPEKATLEHVNALARKTGKHEPSNCRLACAPCNLRAGSLKAGQKAKLREQIRSEAASR